MGRRKAMVVGGLALEMLLSPVIGAILGGWADKRFNTTPWLFWAGLLLGVGSAARMGMRIYRIGKQVMDAPPGAVDKEDER